MVGRISTQVEIGVTYPNGISAKGYTEIDSGSTWILVVILVRARHSFGSVNGCVDGLDDGLGTSDQSRSGIDCYHVVGSEVD